MKCLFESRIAVTSLSLRVLALAVLLASWPQHNPGSAGRVNDLPTSRPRTTPLIEAIHRGKALEAAPLIRAGADPNDAGSTAMSPLCCAAGLPDMADVAMLLIEKGAAVNATSEVEFTPLHYACEDGADEVVKCLLQHGADVTRRDSTGATPLHVLVGANHAAPKHRAVLVELLVSQGAPVNAVDGTGATPLDEALAEGHDNLARTLIKLGAKKGSELRAATRPSTTEPAK